MELSWVMSGMRAVTDRPYGDAVRVNLYGYLDFRENCPSLHKLNSKVI
jgi:hypothetical protein